MLRPLTGATAPLLRPIVRQQIRGKKTLPKAITIPVILLQDVPQLGRRGSVVAVPRGRMRNILYPRKAADYYTSRAPPPLVPIDPTFMATPSTSSTTSTTTSAAIGSRTSAAPARTFATPPGVIHEILNSKLPGVLEFHRRLMVEGEPEIFGSVSEKDVVERIRESLVEDDQAKIVGGVKEEWVKMEKMKMVGEQQVLLQVKGSLEDEGVRRTVRVVGSMG